MFLYVIFLFVTYYSWDQQQQRTKRGLPNPKSKREKFLDSRALTKAPEMGIPVPLAFKKPVRSLKLKFTRENAGTFAQHRKLIIVQPLVFGTLLVGCGFCWAVAWTKQTITNIDQDCVYGFEHSNFKWGLFSRYLHAWSIYSIYILNTWMQIPSYTPCL